MPEPETLATSTGPEIVRLAADQVPAAARMASRAFFADPACTFLFPNHKRREKILEPYLQLPIRYASYYGLNCAPAGTGEDVGGVAVWIPPPGRYSLRLDGMLRCGLLRTTLRLRPLEFLRLTVMDFHAGLLSPDTYTAPHLYLWLLAVDPTRQGTGIGSALLREGLARADAAGVPCILETGTERNVRFYQRHGFEVVREARCPFGGPHLWVMRRDVPTG